MKKFNRLSPLNESNQMFTNLFESQPIVDDSKIDQFTIRLKSILKGSFLFISNEVDYDDDYEYDGFAIHLIVIDYNEKDFRTKTMNLSRAGKRLKDTADAINEMKKLCKEFRVDIYEDDDQGLYIIEFHKK